MPDDRRSFNLKHYVKMYWPLLMTMFFLAGAWYQVKYNLDAVTKDLDEKSRKYIPIIEATEHRVTIQEERTQQVLAVLNRIERKIDRDH